jgi:hypothetical protein
MIRSVSTLLLALFAVPALAAQHPGGGGTGGTQGKCADTVATQVQGSSKPAVGADVKTCGLGFVIFGFGGGVVGEECPTTEVKTPAHQECKGEKGEYTKCVPNGDVPVTARDCECGGLVIPGLRIGIPADCKCAASYPFGTVEDAKTVLCE